MVHCVTEPSGGRRKDDGHGDFISMEADIGVDCIVKTENKNKIEDQTPSLVSSIECPRCSGAET